MKVKNLKKLLDKLPENDNITFVYGTNSFSDIGYICHGREVDKEMKNDPACIELPENEWLFFLIK